MTLNEIKQSDTAYLNITDIAGVLNAAPQAIRNQIWREPERLGFPVIVIGTRIRIPRIPFLDFLTGEGVNSEKWDNAYRSIGNKQ